MLCNRCIKIITLRQFPSPVNFSDTSNWTSVLVHNLEHEENIAKQREPLDSQIFAELVRLAFKASGNSLEVVVANLATA